MNKAKINLVVLLSIIILCGCENKIKVNNSTNNKVKDKVVENIEETNEEDEEMFSEDDYDSSYDKSKCVNVLLKDKTATCDKDAIRVDGGIITIIEEGTYVFSGKLKNGMIVVDAKKEDTIQIVLKGVEISSKESAPIYVKRAKKVYITLEKDTKNKLVNKEGFTKLDKTNIDSVIFAKEDLTINGKGSLNVISSMGHAIVSKKDLIVVDGNVSIEASRHGLSAKDSIRIGGGNIEIDSGRDGLNTDNTEDDFKGYICIEKVKLDIDAQDDGIHACNQLVINSGIININDSYEGLEGDSVDVFGGEINIVASDDGINAAGGNDKSGFKGPHKDNEDTFINEMCYINISGGEVTIDASGDGMDSNGSILVTGGKTYISGPTKGGNCAIDYSVDAQITGGVLIATSTKSMATNFSEGSAQGAIMLNINGEKNDIIELFGNKNKSLLKWKAKKKFENVILSCPDILVGDKYVIKVKNKKEEIIMDDTIYGESAKKDIPQENNLNHKRNKKEF